MNNRMQRPPHFFKALVLGLLLSSVGVLGLSCCGLPSPDRFPENTRAVFQYEGDIVQVSSESRKLEILRKSSEPSSDGTPFSVWSSAILGQGGLHLFWVRCFTATQPEHTYIIRPTGPWELGVTDLLSGVDSVLMTSEAPIYLQNIKAFAEGPVVSVRTSLPNYADPSYRYYRIICEASDPMRLVDIDREEARATSPVGIIRGYRHAYWIGPNNKWVFFMGDKRGFCGYKYLGGFHLASGEQRLLHPLSIQILRD